MDLFAMGSDSMSMLENKGMVEAFRTLNIYAFSFNVLSLALAAYVFHGWIILGPYCRHMLLCYLTIGVLDLWMLWNDIPRHEDILVWQIRQLFARWIIGWGVAYCFLWKSYRVKIKKAVSDRLPAFRSGGESDGTEQR